MGRSGPIGGTPRGTSLCKGFAPSASVWCACRRDRLAATMVQRRPPSASPSISPGDTLLAATLAATHGLEAVSARRAARCDTCNAYNVGRRKAELLLYAALAVDEVLRPARLPRSLTPSRRAFMVHDGPSLGRSRINSVTNAEPCWRSAYRLVHRRPPAADDGMSSKAPYGEHQT
jgi:hypothetical protein